MNIRIVTRGDDSGSSHSANQAIADAYQNGIMRNTSIMVPAPIFREAAGMYRDMEGLCIGLHGTVTDEWNTHRWGPVLGADKAPSLVMEDGTFFKSVQELHDNNPSNHEILAELKAQLETARSEGLNIGYMDTHMGFSWFDGIKPLLQDFAESEGLVYSPKLSRLPSVKGNFSDPVEELIARLENTEHGKTYLLVGHPCYNQGDIIQMTYGDHKPGEIALERDWQRRMFMDDQVLECMAKKGIEPIAYTEI